jgi:hypothetical protein
MEQNPLDDGLKFLDPLPGVLKAAEVDVKKALSHDCDCPTLYQAVDQDTGRQTNSFLFLKKHRDEGLGLLDNRLDLEVLLLDAWFQD